MRLVVALLVGIGLVFGLSLLVDQFDAAPKRTNRAQPSQASAAAADERMPSRLHAEPSEPSPAPRARRGVAGLGLRLRPIRGTILLARSISAIPPDVAPVIEVLASGELVLRRPSPLPQGPGQQPGPSVAGHGAGIVLPAADLAGLSSLARGGLVQLIRQWVTERPVAPKRLAASGIGMASDSLRRLLSWVP